MLLKRISLCLLLVLLSGMARAGIQDGLIAHYPFNGNANDISGNTFHATVNSGGVQLTADRFGHASSAYHFAGGASDYISASIPALPQGTAPRSLCLWVKSDDGAVNGNADHTANWGTYNNGQGFGAMMFTGNTWYGYGHGLGYDLNSGATATTGWQFLVCTYDGGTLKIYVDGTLRNQAGTALNTIGFDLIFGTNPPPLQAWNSFDGCLDDIRVYNRALSDAEVLELYAETSLPVSLLQFDATRTPNTVTLLWETASETDILGFILKRRALPQGAWTSVADYQSHAALHAAGNSSEARHYEYIDTEVRNDTAYQYRLLFVDRRGTHHETGQILTVGLPADLPQQGLRPAFPNPLRTETTLVFDLNESGAVTLSVSDLLGRSVKRLQHGPHTQGTHTCRWNGRDENGQRLPGGCYLIVLKTAAQCYTQKVTVIH